MPITYQIKALNAEDWVDMHGLMNCYAEVFEQEDVYSSNRPNKEYLQDLLNDSSFIAIVAIESKQSIGALVAYELRNFEQRRSEPFRR